jgi:hypothetical protein
MTCNLAPPSYTQHANDAHPRIPLPVQMPQVWDDNDLFARLLHPTCTPTCNPTHPLTIYHPHVLCKLCKYQQTIPYQQPEALACPVQCQRQPTRSNNSSTGATAVAAANRFRGTAAVAAARPQMLLVAWCCNSALPSCPCPTMLHASVSLSQAAPHGTHNSAWLLSQLLASAVVTSMQTVHGCSYAPCAAATAATKASTACWSAAADHSCTAQSSCSCRCFQGLLVLVFVLMGLPLLKLAARSLNVLALSRHSARRAMPATISGASGATCTCSHEHTPHPLRISNLGLDSTTTQHNMRHTQLTGL